MIRGEQRDTVATQIVQGFNLILQETQNFSLLPDSGVYRFLIPDGRSVPEVVTVLTNVPGVGYAMPNFNHWLQGGSGQPALDLQYALPKMRVPDAQTLVNGRGTTIAVIDSAVDWEHPAFKDAILERLDVVEGGIDEPHMHGTAIAGIIAAGGDLVGIAPGAKILAVRAFASESLGMEPVTSSMTLAKAVNMAFEQGARIFNLSFAGPRDLLLLEMIDSAYSQGSIFVAAVGNEGPGAPPAYPGAYEKVIAITATDEADVLYSQANRGDYVSAAAPGVDILAPVVGQSFDYLSGTSFAAAHVTGIIALLRERNPQLTAEAARGILENAAQDLGGDGLDKEFGAGLADAYGSLLLVDKK